MVNPSREPHVWRAYGQTTAITFIFRINPFPLCWHISQRGRARFYFCFWGTQAVKILPLLHPWRCPATTTTTASPPPLLHFIFSFGLRCESKEEDEESRSVCHYPFSLARLYSPRTVCGCVATSKHFFHSRLSSARQLGPLTVNLPARCEGQTRAIFLLSHCQTLEKHFQWMSSLFIKPQSLHRSCQRWSLTTLHHRIVHNKSLIKTGFVESWHSWFIQIWVFLKTIKANIIISIFQTFFSFPKAS